MMVTEKQLIKILVVEDDEDDYFLFSEYLKDIDIWQFELKWISRYEEALQVLCTNEYTLCFCDYLLGLKNGIDLIREAQERHSTTPVILLTGKGTQKIDIEAMKAGAFDYLVKDELDEDKLERIIRYSLERIGHLEKLSASERRYRSFFERSIDIVFIADHEMVITAINDAVQDLLHTSATDCRFKMKLTDFFYDDHAKEHFHSVLNIEGELNNFEVRLVGATGEIVTCLLNASLEKNEQDQHYIQGIIHDISYLKKAETALLQTEKLAASGRFIQTLAHEVRNPLKNIKMAVQQMLKPHNQVDEKILLDIIDRSEIKIDHIITSLLQTTHPADMQWKTLILNELVEQVVAAVKDKAVLRHIELVVDGAEAGEIIIQGDEDKLAMALINILVNSIEAVQDESGKIKVLFFKKGDKAVLQVRDNGCGMSQENKSKLFEPYFTSKPNGIGLGLATTLNILKAHKAMIEVDSILDKGTVFTISFDLLPAATDFKLQT